MQTVRLGKIKIKRRKKKGGVLITLKETRTLSILDVASKTHG